MGHPNADIRACSARTGANKIDLGAGTYGLTLPANDQDASAGGPLAVSSPITIVGQGVGTTAINAHDLYRAFNVLPGASLTLEGLTVTGGRAPAGTDANSTEPATAGGSGGAILSAGALRLMDAAVTGNVAGNGGSASYPASPSEPPTAGGNGGGASLADPAPATFTNSTIANNAAGHWGANLPPAGSLSTGGALLQTGGTVTLAQMTIAGNSEDDSFEDGANVVTNATMTIANSALAASCQGTITDGGHNVTIVNSSSQCAGTQVTTSALGLGTLKANGGPTQTMLPAATSALINAVPAHRAGCPPTDQRGVPRPQGRECDAGAVERRPVKLRLSLISVRFKRTQAGRTRRDGVTLTYTSGEAPLNVGTATITGRGAQAFKITSNSCRHAMLQLTASCRVVILFKPRKPGRAIASLNIALARAGTPVRIRLVGAGVRRQ